MTPAERERRAKVSEIAAGLGIDVPADWRGCDAVWELLERMKLEGAVVLVKLDGMRRSNTYTVVAHGRPLGEHSIRTDAKRSEDALAYLIVEYDRMCWSRPEGSKP